MTTERLDLAKWGAAAYEDAKGELPTAFPRIMGPNAMKYVQEVVESGLTTNMMTRFEQAFAEAHGVKHCIASPGCTPALDIFAAAMDLEPGDEVIVSPITDYGSVHGLMMHNLIPVFADVDPGMVNMSAATIEPCITDRTRAILCVHNTGIICDMDPINELAEKHGLVVYEDACQAVLGRYKGRLAGTLAKAAGFSFDAEKTMGSDIGGCLLTDDDELAQRARFLGHSRGAVFEPGFGRTHTEMGHALRMPNCTAAICLAQLEIMPELVAHIDKMVRYLTNLLADIPGISPIVIPDYVDVYSAWMTGFNIDPEQFTCTTAEFAKQVADKGIPGAGMGEYYLMPAALKVLQRMAANKEYPYSMPPASREYTYSAETCPNAHALLKTWIRWATWSEKYQPEHCERAAEIIREVADANRK